MGVVLYTFLMLLKAVLIVIFVILSAKLIVMAFTADIDFDIYDDEDDWHDEFKK